MQTPSNRGKKEIICGLRSVLAELLLPSAEMKHFLHAIGVSVVFMCMFIFESCNIVSFFFLTFEIATVCVFTSSLDSFFFFSFLTLLSINFFLLNP